MSRCPCCHEDLGELFVACRQCLAKHHGGCWLEHGACASCGEERFLGDPSRGNNATPTSLSDAIKRLREGPTDEQLAAMTPRGRRMIAGLHLVFALLPLLALLNLFDSSLSKSSAFLVLVASLVSPPIILALVWRDMKRWYAASRHGQGAPRTRTVPLEVAEKVDPRRNVAEQNQRL